MKTLKITSAFIIILMLSFTSCKKDPGFGGDANVKGVVTINGVATPGAIVYISFDTKTASDKHDGTTVTDAGGNYTFGGITRGDYFVTATYTSPTGIMFKSGGAHVEIGKKKGDVTVNLTLE